jgi:IclR family mhp operon transcriptional activator
MARRSGLSGNMRGVVRALSALRALNQRNGAGISDLSRMTGIPRPSLYRILDTLVALGYVRRRADGERYELTLLVRNLSDGFRDEDWVRGIALPAIEALQKEIVWPAEIGTFFNDAMYLRETTRRHSPLTIDYQSPGLRVPLLLSAAGRAYLAFCPERERATILDNLKKSSDPNDALARDARYVRNMLAVTRRNGYGQRHGEVYPKTGAIAVPVLQGSRVICCLSFTFIASVLTPKEAAARYLKKLRAAADDVERQLAARA